jgi:hypothetical protein
MTMNLTSAISRSLNARRPQPVVVAHSARPASPARTTRAKREFGVGYGNSSGYASGKRYVRDWGNARFRFA